MKMRNGIFRIPGIPDPGNVLALGDGDAFADPGRVSVLRTAQAVVGSRRVIVNVNIIISITVIAGNRDHIAIGRFGCRCENDPPAARGQNWRHFWGDKIVAFMQVSASRVAEIIGKGCAALDGKNDAGRSRYRNNRRPMPAIVLINLRIGPV